jgi:putative PEP-CTERM system TPR-repeat lipoprotein
MENGIFAPSAILNSKKLLLSVTVAALCTLAACSEEMTEADHLTRAEAAFNQGDVASMAIELKNALRLNPNNGEARYLLGQTYYNIGDGPSAEKELRRALELGIAKERIHVTLARAVLLNGEFRDLLREFPVEESMSTEDQAALLAIRGMAHLNLAELEAATESFDRANEIDPKEPLAALGHAHIARTLGDNEKAIEWLNISQESDNRDPEAWSLRGDLELAAGNRDAAEEAYSKAIENSPFPVKYLLQRSLLHIDNGDYGKARQDISRMPGRLPGRHYALALIQLKSKDYLKAQAAFELALSKNEEYAPAQYYLGLTHVMLGNDGQAASWIRRFLIQVPESVPAATLLAKLEVRQGNLASAQALLDPIFSENPEAPEAMDLMAGLELMQGQNREALSRYRALLAKNPGSANTHSKVGLAMILSGQVKEGRKELEKAIELAPEDEQLELKLVLAQLQAGAQKGAVEAAEKWTERRPESVAAHLALAWSHLNNQSNNEAVAAFGKVLNLEPGNPSASHNLAVLALYNGQVEAAKEFYERSQMLYQGHPRTSIALARIYQQTNEIEKAIALLKKTLVVNPNAIDPGTLLADYQLLAGHTEEALKTAERLYQTNPENPGVLGALGTSRAANGKYVQAVTAFEQLKVISKLSPENYYKLAMSQSRAGDRTAFSQTIREAYSAYPDNYPIQVAAADQFLADKELGDADRLISRVIERYPQRLASYDQAMRLAQMRGDYEAALAAAQKTRQLAPEDSQYVVKLAVAMWRVENTEGAFNELENWMASHPNDQLVDYNLANFYMLAKRDKEAIDAFTRVLQRNNEHLLGLNNLAWLLREKEPEKALELAERAFALDPEAAPIQDTLAVILMETPGEEERAIALLRKATSTAPNRTDFQYHLALALSKNGDNRLAHRVLSTMLRANEDFPEKSDAEALKAAVPE